MFLMDSVNAGKRNTKRSLAFLKTLVEELDIDHDNIHVGLMSAECQPDDPGFSLKSHTSVRSIQTAVDELKTMDIHSIIHKMRRKAFSTSHGGRKHAKKIAILIIDGSLEEPLKTLREAQRARIRGVEVFVIQVMYFCLLIKGYKCKFEKRTSDFQQCGILTSVDKDEPLQPPFELSNSK